MLIDSNSKKWRRDVVLSCFNPHEAKQILSLPLSHRLPQDKIIWCWEKNDEYSVRSAYQLLDDRKNCNQPSPSSIFQESLWGKIWKAAVPNVIRNFLWRLVKHILPSRARLAKKGLNVDPCCPLCYQQAEDYEHIFMSCPIAKLTWFASPLGLHAPSDLDVNSWVL
ncbi:retrotransposon unclassified-like protein [Trifolium medium]|uniref:Retrotransposon unclassified-like protein n=1 Tax=Trifolium medium TaxID=97028 RepID=A0A392ND60_9FABA|nr:retrotransposon unclassified-like protein [Trifolium medium]